MDNCKVSYKYLNIQRIIILFCIVIHYNLLTLRNKKSIIMITELEAINQRRSIRKYKNIPIDNQLIELLNNKVKEVNQEGDLHIQLITNEPKAFKGKMAYGTFSGVTNYFAMIGKQSETLDERIGYYGEKLVVFAEQLGLNSCWVGVTYNNIKEAYIKEKGEKLCCLIALGYGDESGRQLKRKSIEEVSNISTETPEWFQQGVKAALLAPTAVNQQKFFFKYMKPTTDDSICKIEAKRGFSLVGYTKIDLGICKYHFEIGAQQNKFEWV